MNRDIAEFMKESNISSYEGLEAYYIHRLIDLLDGISFKKKTYLVWQEVFDNQVPLDPNTIVHIWKGNWENEMSQVSISLPNMYTGWLKGKKIFFGGHFFESIIINAKKTRPRKSGTPPHLDDVILLTSVDLAKNVQPTGRLRTGRQVSLVNTARP